MKKKIALLLVTIMALSSLTACKSATSLETTSKDVISEEAVATESLEEEIPLEPLLWVPLGRLGTHSELRSAVNSYLGINSVSDSEFYRNPITHNMGEVNTTAFMIATNLHYKGIFIVEAPLLKFASIGAENYEDIEETDVIAPYATINAYFELLPDQEEGMFNGNKELSRAEAMTLLMRATTPVNEVQMPETNADFTSMVGENIYTDYAAPMNQYSYLNTSNGLNKETFNATMTKGEYICLVTNVLRADYIKYITLLNREDRYTDTSDITITTVADAGNITLSEAIADASKGVPSDMYETFKLALKNHYLLESSFSDWDSAITKAEAVKIFTEMAVYYSLGAGSGIYTGSQEIFAEYAISKLPRVMETGEWETHAQWSQYAKSQGADFAGEWCWYYENGSAAGDNPSYCVYMNEESPLYKMVYFVGDMLPDGGGQYCGTGEEFKAMMGQGIVDEALKQGLEVEYRDDETVIILD